MSRLILSPDGRFGFWEGNIFSNEQSQRLLDPYSFSHILNGILFYGLLWLITRKIPIRYRFVIALLLEACWEILENSSFIINRYRAVTISRGYFGDSILNSVSDIFMISLGFFMAERMHVPITILVIVFIELGLLYFIRNNLTLNLLMLIYPIKAIQL